MERVAEIMRLGCQELATLVAFKNNAASTFLSMQHQASLLCRPPRHQLGHKATPINRSVGNRLRVRHAARVRLGATLRVATSTPHGRPR